MSVLGILGFLQPFCMHLFPAQFLNRIELPNVLGAVRITAPDGRVFIVSEPFGRVQRYGPSGFERGFSIDSRGGAVEAGVSPSGNILICSVRARGLITYDQEGNEIGSRQPCTYSVSDQGRITSSNYYMDQAKVPFIALNWVAALAVPFWHPMLAWLMIATGGLYLKFHPRSRPNGP